MEKYGMEKKEYDYDGKLMFEGEYLNGERNRRGKEYDYNGKLECEGEFLNGERNGKGKEFGFKGEILFEGEYLKGKKWNGKGKGNNIFSGGEYEYINGISK